MKLPFAAFACSLLFVGCAVPPQSTTPTLYVGDYYSPPPCSFGNAFDLSLHADGSYEMIQTLPEGIGPKMPEGQTAAFREVGRWGFDGVAVILKSDAGKKRTLTPEHQDGGLVLTDGATSTLHLERQLPNRGAKQSAVTFGPLSEWTTPIRRDEHAPHP